MHVYALLHSSMTTLTLPAGVAAPLHRIVHEQIAAVVEPDLRLDELQQDDAILLQAVLAHDRVIRELFLQTTVLPLRFTSFPTLPDLMADLQTNQQAYLATLTRLTGQVELTLKFEPVTIEEQPIGADLKGKDYFLAKKQQYQTQQQQRELQDEELTRIVQAIAHLYPISVQPDSRHVHVLVSQNKLAVLHEQLTKLKQTSTLWRCSIGEPLPPFHFV
ncbi:MAG: GvpL/GvpF family gas vesicle protein [Leptolyngbyaceae cyanobacterium bins.349]|nr:GvpL/GvpF family gas vesicle protein [Leptolyngbyaceae cyanobacterium bins.349]